MIRWPDGKAGLRLRRVVRKIGAVAWRAIHSEDIWREVYASPGVRPEPTLRRFSYLRSRGVRCHLRNLAAPSGRFGRTGMVSLRVHRDDLNKAYLFLKEIKDR